MPARIATWNVWWRFGPWEAREPHIGDELAGLDADVVCLQEVWSDIGDRDPDPGRVQVDGPTPSADRASQAGRLAARLGWQEHRFAWRRAHEGLTFGNAILSRHPITRTATLALPAADRHDECRTALLVDVDTPDGLVHVVTTHLNFLWDHSHVRQEQVTALCRWITDHRRDETPVVLTGDLNAEPVSDEVRMLTGRAAAPVAGFGFHDAWEVAGDGPGPTWLQANTHTPTPPVEGDKRIDYVLVSHATFDGRGIALDAGRFGLEADGASGHPSDHAGVWADVTVAPRR